MRQQDPEMFEIMQRDRELEERTQELTESLRAENGADRRDKLREEIRSHVQEHFGVRQQRRELELKRLEAQLERLRKSIKQREETREQIINRRFAELVGEADESAF